MANSFRLFPTDECLLCSNSWPYPLHIGIFISTKVEPLDQRVYIFLFLKYVAKRFEQALYN